MMTPALPAVHHVIWCTTLVRGGCWWIAVDMRDVTSACSARTPAPNVSAVSTVQPCQSDQLLQDPRGPCQCLPDQCQLLGYHPPCMAAQGLQVWPEDLVTDQVLVQVLGDTTGSTGITGDQPQSTLMTTPCQVRPASYQYTYILLQKLINHLK